MSCIYSEEEPSTNSEMRITKNSVYCPKVDLLHLRNSVLTAIQGQELTQVRQDLLLELLEPVHGPCSCEYLWCASKLDSDLATPAASMLSTQGLNMPKT